MMTMLTYEQQFDLVERKLAVKKTDGIYDTFKYHRRVMYDYLWDSEPDVWECRGHVYDNTDGSLVQAAPRKSFNYLENNWWKDVSLDSNVVAYKKINGYMACITKHKGQTVVSTTGSTTSEYAKWARELMYEDNENFIATSDFSTIFEVVLPQDPHIVKEKTGLHCLGWRNKHTGTFLPYGNAIEGSLSDILYLASSDRGEGFMVYLPNGACCKVKTPYYAGKKKLMRMKQSQIEQMFAQPNKTVDNFHSMFSEVIYAIIQIYTTKSWIDTSEQDRRKFIENIIGE